MKFVEWAFSLVFKCVAWIFSLSLTFGLIQKRQARRDFSNRASRTAETRHQSGSLDSQGQGRRVRILASGWNGRRYSGEGSSHAAAISAWSRSCEASGFRLTAAPGGVLVLVFRWRPAVLA